MSHCQQVGWGQGRDVWSWHSWPCRAPPSHTMPRDVMSCTSRTRKQTLNLSPSVPRVGRLRQNNTNSNSDSNSDSDSDSVKLRTRRYTHVTTTISPPPHRLILPPSLYSTPTYQYQSSLFSPLLAAVKASTHARARARTHTHARTFDSIGRARTHASIHPFMRTMSAAGKRSISPCVTRIRRRQRAAHHTSEHM